MVKQSHLIKRSIEIAGHQTSLTLEPEFWTALKDIAQARHQSLPQLVAAVDQTRPEGRNLSSALRVFVLNTIKGAG